MIGFGYPIPYPSGAESALLPALIVAVVGIALGALMIWRDLRAARRSGSEVRIERPADLRRAA